MRLLSRSEQSVATTVVVDERDALEDDLTVLKRAEAEATAAEAQAATARARAEELRRKADLPDESADDIDDGAGLGDGIAAPGKRWQRPGLATMMSIIAVIVSAALLAASGYMFWYHHQTERAQRLRGEFAAAASQAVLTLMSIDSAKAEDDVAQIIANSTGQFRDDFRSAADDFIKVAHDSKAVTKATVQASAVESIEGDSAVVLVSAATTVSNSAGSDQQPRHWRLAVTMHRDGDQIKMSQVEFIP